MSDSAPPKQATASEAEKKKAKNKKKKKKTGAGAASAAAGGATAGATGGAAGSASTSVAGLTALFADTLKISPLPKYTDELDKGSLGSKINARSSAASDAAAAAPKKEESKPAPKEEAKGKSGKAAAAAAAAAAAPTTEAKLTAFPFKLIRSADGRRAVATQPIEAGQLIIREQAFSWNVHLEMLGKACNNCGADFPEDEKAIAQASTSGGKGSVRREFEHACAVCTQALYCSAACKKQHAKFHAHECPILKAEKVKAIADSSNVDADLVRIALSVLIRVGMEKEDKEAPAVSVDPFLSRYADVAELVSHENMIAASDRANLRAAAAGLLQAVPEPLRMEENKLVELMCIVNANSHALHQTSRHDSFFGFGLFPLASTFNHSCFPNCFFSNEGDVVSYRALRPIAAGEELVVNYIELYHSRPSRRGMLMQSKKFFCQCRRCLVKPATEEEKLKFANDQFIGAIMCQKGGCTGHYREVDTAEGKAFAKKHAAAAAASAAGDAKAAEGEKKAEEKDPFWMPECVFQCSACKQVATATQLTPLVERAQAAYNKAMSLYALPDSSASTSRAGFDRFYDQTSTILHSKHTLLFQTYLSYINCCGAAQDFKAKLEYARLGAKLAEETFPENFLAQAYYHQTVATAILQIRGTQKVVIKKLSQEYRKERLAALEKTYKAHLVCLGPTHPLTKNQRQQFEDAKKEKWD